MKDWKTMSTDERKAVRAELGSAYANKDKMNTCLHEVKSLLESNPRAAALAGKIAWGCYLINTPEDIAAYCIEQVEAG